MAYNQKPPGGPGHGGNSGHGLNDQAAAAKALAGSLQQMQNFVHGQAPPGQSGMGGGHGGGAGPANLNTYANLLQQSLFNNQALPMQLQQFQKQMHQQQQQHHHQQQQQHPSQQSKEPLALTRTSSASQEMPPYYNQQQSNGNATSAAQLQQQLQAFAQNPALMQKIAYQYQMQQQQQKHYPKPAEQHKDSSASSSSHGSHGTVSKQQQSAAQTAAQHLQQLQQALAQQKLLASQGKSGLPPPISSSPSSSMSSGGASNQMKPTNLPSSTQITPIPAPTQNISSTMSTNNNFSTHSKGTGQTPPPVLPPPSVSLLPVKPPVVQSLPLNAHQSQKIIQNSNIRPTTSSSLPLLPPQLQQKQSPRSASNSPKPVHKSSPSPSSSPAKPSNLTASPKHKTPQTPPKVTPVEATQTPSNKSPKAFEKLESTNGTNEVEIKGDKKSKKEEKPPLVESPAPVPVPLLDNNEKSKNDEKEKVSYLFVIEKTIEDALTKDKRNNKNQQKDNIKDQDNLEQSKNKDEKKVLDKEEKNEQKMDKIIDPIENPEDQSDKLKPKIVAENKIDTEKEKNIEVLEEVKDDKQNTEVIVSPAEKVISTPTLKVDEVKKVDEKPVNLPEPSSPIKDEKLTSIKIPKPVQETSENPPQAEKMGKKFKKSVEESKPEKVEKISVINVKPSQKDKTPKKKKETTPLNSPDSPVTDPLSTPTPPPPAKVTPKPSVAKAKISHVSNEDTISTPGANERKSSRARLQTNLYQSPLPEIEQITRISANEASNSPKPLISKDSQQVFYKNEYVAVRNAESGFFLCQVMQKVYLLSRKIRIRWLSEEKTGSNIYIPDFYDNTDIDCILTNVRLKKIEKGQLKFQLPDEEKQRIENILKKAIDVEKGIVPRPDITETNPDGLDISLYKEESLVVRSGGGTTKKAVSTSKKRTKVSPTPVSTKKKSKLKSKRKLATTSEDDDAMDDTEDDEYKPSKTKRRKSGASSPIIIQKTVAPAHSQSKNVRAQRSPLAKARAASPITPTTSRSANRAMPKKTPVASTSGLSRTSRANKRRSSVADEDSDDIPVKRAAPNIIASGRKTSSSRDKINKSFNESITSTEESAEKSTRVNKKLNIKSATVRVSVAKLVTPSTSSRISRAKK